jgi:uncharacterized protein YjdB
VVRVNATTGRLKALKAGTARITVAAGGRTATLKVTVVRRANATAVRRVSVKGVPGSLAVGKVAWATATWKPKAATGATVTFRTSKASVLAVDKAGRLLAKAPGTARITIKVGHKAVVKKVRVTR